MDALFDARVDMFVENDRVVAFEKSSEDGEIREETAAEKKRLIAVEKRRGEILQPRMRRVMAAQEPRTSGANHAVLFYRLDHSLAQRRVPREAQIIVRGKVDALGEGELTEPMRALQPLHLGTHSWEVRAQLRLAPAGGSKSTLWLANKNQKKLPVSIRGLPEFDPILSGKRTSLSVC